MSNRIALVRGTSRTFEVDVVDDQGEPVDSVSLGTAVATFSLRQTADDQAPDVLFFTSSIPLSRLSISTTASRLKLSFIPTDTEMLELGSYFYRLQLTLATGDVLDVIEWTPLDLIAGGSASPTPPVFENTVKIDADFGLSGDLEYRTPGGSPIEGAQVRVYLKAEYDAGNLTTPVGITVTDARGRWRQPILVSPGYEYVVRFEKTYEFGPDVKVVTA